MEKNKEKKVIALQSLKNGMAKSYGEGVLLGDRIPKDGGMFEENKIKNPCIKLDSGKYVWGFECWWGEKERFLEKYKDAIDKTEIVEPNNYLPLEEE